MALVLADRVQETTTTTGTGTLTLLGAATGYQSFAAVGNTNTTYYCIQGQTSAEWEVGIGTYTSSGTTLSRDTVLSSSNSGSLVNLSAGTKNVFVTYPATRSVYVNGTTITPTNSGILPIASGGTGSSATAYASLTANVSGILPGANGGTNNGFTQFSGPTTSLKTFSLPDATATILTTNAAVTVAQGGTGVTTTPTNGQLLVGNGTNYTVATLGSGTGISTTTGAGTLTINNTGVTSLTTSSGLSTNTSATGAVSVTNTGVTSNVAGTGISVSGSTGAVTITNSGVTSAVAGTGVSVSSSTGAVTFSIGQAVATSSNVQFSSIGVGSAASGTAGRINAATGVFTPGTTGVSTGLNVVNGDITTYRSGGTTGVVYLSSSGSNYLYWDGTNYNLNGGNLVVTGNVTAYSDETLKTNWRDLPTDFVTQLAGLKHGIYTRIDSGDDQAGISAQKLQEFLPQVVQTDEKGKLSVAYGNAAMVSAVQLAQRVVEQDARIARLEAIVAKLTEGK